jgi:hypothetical protein
VLFVLNPIAVLNLMAQSSHGAELLSAPWIWCDLTTKNTKATKRAMKGILRLETIPRHGLAFTFVVNLSGHSIVGYARMTSLET